jgi:hypothetical protein
MWIIGGAIVIGLLGLYLGVIRPILEAKPQFKQFYEEADGFWKTAWAFSYKSLTVLVSYVQGILGILATQLDSIASLLGDPDFKTQITNLIGADTKTIGYILMGISIVTFAARMRSISKGD